MFPAISELGQFVGADRPEAACHLVLPHYAGPASLDTGGGSLGGLTYRGATFAERDSRAAFYVQSLVSPVFDPERISIEAAVAGETVQPTTFLFGSRSNVLLDELKPYYQNLFRFEFGDDWKIHIGAQTFSMPDPSKIDPSVYQLTTDYGIIAKIPLPAGAVFLIAGLGGRATEGSAYFFRKNWRQVLKTFRTGPPVAVLRFDPPFAIEKSTMVSPALAAWAF